METNKSTPSEGIIMDDFASTFDFVQDTNDSSTISKISTCRKGYVVDPFIEKMSSFVSFRSPLINRGYYIRCKAIHQCLVTFINEFRGGCQILSLGAGFDTSYFRLTADGLTSKIKYVEVDFPRVVNRKGKLIQQCDVLKSYLVEPDNKNGLFSAAGYYIVGCDITNTDLLKRKLVEDCLMDFNLPTFILSECVLTYISPHKVDGLISWCSSVFSEAIMCTYEQIHPDDGFGKVMCSHFVKRKSPLLNVDMYQSPELLMSRYRNLGWAFSKCCDMNDYYFSLPLEEHKRVDKLELFDEFEEMELKCCHYVLLCSSSNSLISLAKFLVPDKYNVVSNFERLEVTVEELKFSEDSPNLIARYGHSSVKYSPDEVVVIGGFGVSQGSCHKRLDDVTLLTFNKDGSLLSSKPQLDGIGPGSIIHHKAILLSGCRVLITGGRKSPCTPSNNLYLLQLARPCCSWEKIIVEPESDDMSGRWRHSATVLTLNGEECVMIIGGRDMDTVHEDCYIIHTMDWRVEQICSLPEGRHSHTAIEYNTNVLIVGGLKEDCNHANNCIKLYQDVDRKRWTISTFTLLSPLLQRYSIGSCLSERGEVYLLGGVGRDLNVYLTQLKLETMSATTSDITEAAYRMRILYCNFTLHKVFDKIVIIGGGGNCFSFGTHFNCICTFKI